MYQVATKFRNGHKIYQMALTYIFEMAIENTNIFHSKALQNLPKFGFLVRKIPSGNPGPLDSFIFSLLIGLHFERRQNKD
jgi:hypothetical protein